MSGADLERALDHYRALAPRYDRRTRWIDGIRLEAIEALDLRAGDVVLDAGCGTGWCLPHLARRIGREGTIIAFDPSPDMLDRARVRRVGCRVELLHATAQAVRLPREADAVLFSYTHDLIRSDDALDRIFAQVRVGARVAATSTKLYAPWLFPLNAWLRWTHRGYITDFEGFEAPWSVLAPKLEEFSVRTGPLTQHYVARGRVRSRG